MDQERVDNFKSRMNSLAYGEAMLAAARDYGNELIEQERKANEAQKYAAVNVDDLLDDPELAKIHEQRIEQLKSENEKRQRMSQQGHGELTDITEGDFLEVVTKTKFVVAHFFHKEFERCKIIDMHLKKLAARYFETRFIKLSAPDAPFFVAKLQVQMLPCVIMFVDGVAVDRVVGFGELGSRDDFNVTVLEGRFASSGVLKKRLKTGDDSDDDAAEYEQQQTSVRRGVAASGYRDPDDECDEDSDFD